MLYVTHVYARSKRERTSPLQLKQTQFLQFDMAHDGKLNVIRDSRIEPSLQLLNYERFQFASG